MSVAQQEEWSLDRTTAIKYLKIYVADIDWNPHIDQLFINHEKRVGREAAKEMMRKQLSCAILLPTYDKSVLTDPPQNLLFWCAKYSQFEQRDWPKELQAVIKRDSLIEEYRAKCLALGVIWPIEYCPITRQAFNWLFKKAVDTHAVTPQTKAAITKRMQNLVLAYGGAVICNIMMKDQYHNKVYKLSNWRSAYFFERLIFEIYSLDDVLKIKQQELKKVDQKLIKQIKD